MTAEPIPRTPKAILLVTAILFFAPFFCLFLPAELAMDRDYSRPYLAYTTPFVIAAWFFFYGPMLLWDALRPPSLHWFYVFAFGQSLLLTLLGCWVLRVLLWSRWRQLSSRVAEETSGV